MTEVVDELGLSCTTTSAASPALFNDVIDAYLGSSPRVVPLLDNLLASDPEMPLALVLRGYLLKLAADPRLAGAITQIHARLTQLREVNPREQMHIAAFNRWADGDMIGATEILETLLLTHPKDMLALRVAHYLHFYAGDSGAMQASVARSVSLWRPDERFYGYLLGMYAFGLEEAGDYEAAEARGRTAIDINRGDIWAGHAVTHVFQMQQRFDEGVDWLAALLPAWVETNNFRYHLHWHKALCHIGLGDADTALGIFDEHLEAALADDFYLDVCNAASLLWRLDLLGVATGERWETLRDLSRARVRDDELIFSSLHYLMGPVRLGDEEAVQAALGHLAAWAETNTTQGRVCRQVGLSLGQAIACLGRGDTQQARDLFMHARDQVYLIGGSHAQRDLFNLLHASTL
ncbi:MAG: tetratricopeptide repeat protein [Pseudomonadota bacterium]